MISKSFWVVGCGYIFVDGQVVVDQVVHILDDFDGLGVQHQARGIHVHVLQVLDFV